MEDLIKFIELNSVFTGSRAFGVGNVTSDYDYVMHIGNYNQVVNNLKDMFYEYKESSYFVGVEFKYDNKTYNVFFVHPNEIKSWQYATSMIKIMCEDGGYFNEIKVDKKKRIMLFESFRALLKGMLS